jgi:hypothetical protein
MKSDCGLYLPHKDLPGSDEDIAALAITTVYIVLLSNDNLFHQDWEQMNILHLASGPG